MARPGKPVLVCSKRRSLVISSRRLGAVALIGGMLAACPAGAEPPPPEGASSASPAAVQAEPPSPVTDLMRRFLETNDPELGLSLARALVESGRWLEADAFYRQAAAIDPPRDVMPSALAVKETAIAEREQLTKRFPGVVVTVDGVLPSKVQVYVNGTRMATAELGTRRWVDPGSVRVEGVLDGARVETAVELGEGETRPVRLAFKPRQAPPPVTLLPASGPGLSPTGNATGRVVGFVAMGLGGAALITGGVFGVLALRDEASLRTRCPDDTCPSSRKPDVDAYESKKTITTVGLATGALLGVGGAALYWLSSRPSSASTGVRTGVFVGASRAGVWGAF